MGGAGVVEKILLLLSFRACSVLVLPPQVGQSGYSTSPPGNVPGPPNPSSVPSPTTSLGKAGSATSCWPRGLLSHLDHCGIPEPGCLIGFCLPLGWELPWDRDVPLRLSQVSPASSPKLGAG